MISANNITLRLGKKALFEDVNIKFTEGNCYGMIGANGAGKSTFLKILSGQLEPTSGDIVITPGQRLSFLQQDHFKYDAYTVLDTVIMGNQRLYDIMKEKDAIYAKEDFSDEDGIRASELEAEFAEMDGWNADTEAGQLLEGLVIHEVVKVAVGVGILDVLALNERLFELRGRVERRLGHAAGDDVLHLRADERGALAGLDVLELDDHHKLAFIFKGLAVSEIAGSDRSHCLSSCSIPHDADKIFL